VTHDEIVHAIQARAKARGVLSHYCADSTRCEGDSGLPDLFLAGKFGAAWMEVKTRGAELRPNQTTWKHMLQAADQTHLVVLEAHLSDGRVDRFLDGLAYE
jgi:hypothetical protein